MLIRGGADQWVSKPQSCSQGKIPPLGRQGSATNVCSHAPSWSTFAWFASAPDTRKSATPVASTARITRGASDVHRVLLQTFACLPGSARAPLARRIPRVHIRASCSVHVRAPICLTMFETHTHAPTRAGGEEERDERARAHVHHLQRGGGSGSIEHVVGGPSMLRSRSFHSGRRGQGGRVSDRKNENPPSLRGCTRRRVRGVQSTSVGEERGEGEGRPLRGVAHAVEQASRPAGREGQAPHPTPSPTLRYLHAPLSTSGHGGGVSRA